MIGLNKELSFSNFLLDYVRKLSISGLSDLWSLVDEATFLNVRLRAPLVLMAVSMNEGHRLIKYLQDEQDQTGMLEMAKVLSRSDLEFQLVKGNVPLEYKKVWTSYVCQRDESKRDAALLKAIRKKIRRTQQETGCSTPKICEELSLDVSTVSEWLDAGVEQSINFEIADQIMRFLIDRRNI